MNTLFKLKRRTDRFFSITERGSTFQKEIVAGVLVFFSMLYILPVNTSIFSQIGLPSGAVFAATCISTVVCTTIMSLVGRLPLMMSTSMGMNAYLSFTVCKGLNYSTYETLAIVIITGFLFFIISITPLRMKIVNALPKSLKNAISAGLGFFICFVGLNMGGIIKSNSSTLVSLGSLNESYVLLALFGIILVFSLSVCKNKTIKQFSLIISLLSVALVGGILDLCGIKNMPKFYNPENSSSIIELKDTIFMGFNGFRTIFVKPQTYGIIISLLMVNIFDTTATLIGLGKPLNIINHDGKMINYEKTFCCDGMAPLISGMLSTSPVATFAETSVGVNYGARTGLASLTTALLFLLCLAIFPLFNVFSPIVVNGISYTPVTSLSLVFVGSMMFTHLKDIDWKDPIVTASSFITLVMMLLTYSLTDGIAFGVIIYVLMSVFSGQYKKISPLMYVLLAIFVTNFILNTVISINSNQKLMIFRFGG